MTVLVTGDPRLHAAVEAIVTVGIATVENAWAHAGPVLVGTDALAGAEALASAGSLPRRAGVIVIALGEGEPDPATWRGAVAVGAEQVAVLPQASSWLVQRLAAAPPEVSAAQVTTAHRGVVIGVVGAGGGSGASTLSAALGSRAAARGLRCLVVDADALGGGLDLAFGGDTSPGARWPDVQDARGQISPTTLAAAFPKQHGFACLAHARSGEPVTSMEALPDLIDGARGAFDAIVIDLPRAILRTAELDHWVVITADRLRPVVAASRLLRCDDVAHEAPVIVLRRTRGGTVDARDAAEALDTAIDLVLDHDAAAAEAGEHGDALPDRGPLAVCADRILDRLVDFSVDRSAA